MYVCLSATIQVAAPCSANVDTWTGARMWRFALLVSFITFLFVDLSSCQSNWMSSERDVIWRWFQHHFTAVIIGVIIVITMVTASAADSAGVCRVWVINRRVQRPRRLPTSKHQSLRRSAWHHCIVWWTDSSCTSQWCTGTSTSGLPDWSSHRQTGFEVLAQSIRVPLWRHSTRTSRSVALYTNPRSM